MNQRHSAIMVRSKKKETFVAPSRVGGGSRRSSGVATHVAWAGGGFVLGAVCWHMVGFWSFIDQVLQDAQPISAYVTRVDAEPVVQKSLARLTPYSSAGDCVQRIESSATAVTIVRPCALPVVAMKADIAAQ